MRISRIVVQNYRGLQNVDFNVENDLACIIGENNTGKTIESSTLVDRLGLFNNQRRYHHGQKGAERHFT